MPDDIAETVSWVVDLSDRVNINRIELTPACQASGTTVVKRRKQAEAPHLDR